LNKYEYVKVWDPGGVFYHYEITAKGGNDMEDIENKIEEWENYIMLLKNKISNTKDEQKKIFLKRKLAFATQTLKRLKDRQWGVL